MSILAVGAAMAVMITGTPQPSIVLNLSLEASISAQRLSLETTEEMNTTVLTDSICFVPTPIAKRRGMLYLQPVSY